MYMFVEPVDGLDPGDGLHHLWCECRRLFELEPLSVFIVFRSPELKVVWRGKGGPMRKGWDKEKEKQRCVGACECVCVGFFCIKGRGSRGCWLLCERGTAGKWEMQPPSPYHYLILTYPAHTHTHGHTIPISLSSPQERRFGGAGGEGGGGEVEEGEGRGMEKGTDRGIKIHGSFFYFPCWKSIVFTMNEWNSGQQWCRGDTERERDGKRGGGGEEGGGGGVTLLR